MNLCDQNLAPGDAARTFDWARLVPRIVHPLKVVIVEALLCIDQPLSAAQLSRILDEEFHLSQISHHVRSLAELGALEKVGERPVRGAMESFYFFSRS